MAERLLGSKRHALRRAQDVRLLREPDDGAMDEQQQGQRQRRRREEDGAVQVDDGRERQQHEERSRSDAVAVEAPLLLAPQKHDQHGDGDEQSHKVNHAMDGPIGTGLYLVTYWIRGRRLSGSWNID